MPERMRSGASEDRPKACSHLFRTRVGPVIPTRGALSATGIWLRPPRFPPRRRGSARSHRSQLRAGPGLHGDNEITDYGAHDPACLRRNAEARTGMTPHAAELM